MQTAVEGPMAGGIMQPLKMQTVALSACGTTTTRTCLSFSDIYGDTSAQARKDAIGQFLLFPLHPAGFAVARGDMDIAEA